MYNTLLASRNGNAVTLNQQNQPIERYETFLRSPSHFFFFFVSPYLAGSLHVEKTPWTQQRSVPHMCGTHTPTNDGTFNVPFGDFNGTVALESNRLSFSVLVCFIR